jgi:hypothetical protein
MERSRSVVRRCANERNPRGSYPILVRAAAVRYQRETVDEVADSFLALVEWNYVSLPVYHSRTYEMDNVICDSFAQRGSRKRTSFLPTIHEQQQVSHRADQTKASTTCLADHNVHTGQRCAPPKKNCGDYTFLLVMIHHVLILFNLHIFHYYRHQGETHAIS